MRSANRVRYQEKVALQNIAILIGQLAQGGSERQLYLFLAHCDRSRWNPVLFVSGELGFWEQPIRALGISITLLQGSQLSKMRQFRAACIAHQVSHFFSWSSYTNGFALALTGLHIRCIGSFRNDMFADLPEQNRWLWSWMSLAGISTAICNSHETQAALQRYTGAKKHVVYVPNAVQIMDDDRIAMVRSHWRNYLGLERDELLLLGVGRIVPQKNFVRFVEVVAQVRHSLPVRAVIVGRDDGSLAAVQERATALGLGSDVIRFLGAVPDARELICAADLFMLSSDHEGMPNVVLEALAAKVPCVCTRVNGVKTLIDHGKTGFIAEFSVESLATHVMLLAQNASLRQTMGAQGAETVRRTYESQKIADQLWHVCSEQPFALHPTESTIP